MAGYISVMPGSILKGLVTDLTLFRLAIDLIKCTTLAANLSLEFIENKP